MTAACAGIPVEEFPLWGLSVADAVHRGDGDGLSDLIERLRCGHDAENALLVLPQIAARTIVEAAGVEGYTVAATPKFRSSVPRPVQTAVQLVTAAVNGDVENASALAVVVAKPMLEAASADDMRVASAYFYDVVRELLTIIRDARVNTHEVPSRRPTSMP